MKKISEILEEFDGSALSNATSYVRQSGSQTLQFYDIEFDDFFAWTEEDALKIGSCNIEEIRRPRINGSEIISTYSRNLPKLNKYNSLPEPISMIKLGDYLKFSKKFTKITQIVFHNCIFYYMPDITDNKIWKIEFNECKFLESGNLSKGLLRYTHIPSKRILFNKCIFDTFQLGDISDIQYNKDIKLCRFYLTGGSIENFIIQNIEISSKFYINKQYSGNTEQTKIEELNINNSIFHENFKLHNCLVNESIIEDTDFKKHADFFRSIFREGINSDNQQDKSINFKALNFKGLALFGDCEFHELLRFQYVTFENFSHFRRAKFLKGLDLDYTNIQKEMNFFDIEGLDSKESKENTSQETYRIIKHNFSKIGNTIEANKYHTLELGTHNKNTWEQREITPALLSDGIVSFLFWITSNFSKYWFLPLIWIFIVGLVTASNIGEISLSNIIKYATITQYDYMKKYPILFVFNKASLGFLYYQFILSVRKNTRK